MIHNPANCKLGKALPRADRRNLKLASYVTSLPPLPESCAWGASVRDWPMLANDSYGDCAFAGAAHIEQMFAAANGNVFTPTDDQVLADYAAVTGFNPNEAWTDQGTVLLDALNFWRKTGMCGRAINAFAQVNIANADQVKAAIYLTGAHYAGVQLPLAAQDQKVWDITGNAASHRNIPGSWGGHCIPLIGYDADGPICITWGEVKRITWRWWLAYADEGYAVLSHNWSPSGVAPNHFNYAQLRQDAAAFG